MTPPRTRTPRETTAVTTTDGQQPGTELATFDVSTSKYPILFDAGGEGSFTELIRQNFGDEGITPDVLDKITLPTGGDTYWRVPDEPPIKELRGVIVFWGTTRAFWKVSKDEAGGETTPPDCASADGRVGRGEYGPGQPLAVAAGNPAGQCATCPMNEWDSAKKGSGKACKEQRRLWFLPANSILPMEVQLPPTSIRPFKGYMARLTGKGIPFFAVETVLKLDSVRMGGNDVAVVNPARGDELAPAEATAAFNYGETIKGFLQNVASQSSNGDAEQGPGGANDPFTDGIPPDLADPA